HPIYVHEIVSVGETACGTLRNVGRSMGHDIACVRIFLKTHITLCDRDQLILPGCKLPEVIESDVRDVDINCLPGIVCIGVFGWEGNVRRGVETKDSVCGGVSAGRIIDVYILVSR